MVIFIDILFCYSIAPSFHVYLPFNAIELAEKICDDSELTELTTKELSADKKFGFNNIIDKLEEKIENSELKFFKNFIKFKISVENNIKTKNEEIIKFNIEWIDGIYRESSPNKGKVFLTKKNINGLRELKLENLEYSFKSENEPPIYIANDSENIKFHIEISKINFLLWYLLFSIPISWGVLLLLNSIEKFIISGEPVIKKKSQKTK